MTKISEDVWHIARKVLSGPEEQQLRRIIQRWKAENPDQVRVASVRLSEFANPQAAGFNTLDGEAGGLLAGLKQAVQSADQVRLLAERALFAAQRLPFLLRMHLRRGQPAADGRRSHGGGPGPGGRPPGDEGCCCWFRACWDWVCWSGAHGSAALEVRHAHEDDTGA